MSVRTKMLGFVDVILRVPPIFIIDEILKISMGLPFATQNDSSILENSNSQITTISGSSAGDSMLYNDNSSSNTISSSNFSSNSSSSSLEQFLNTSELFGDAMSAAANSAATAADDTEFYKIVSLTSLKFLSCLLGK